MYVTASETVSLLVEFKAPSGELVIPDTGTFTYTVVELDGTVVLAPQTPTLGASDTTTTVVLSSPTTDKSGSEDFETIRLKYSYDVSGVTLSQTRTIFLVIEPKYVVLSEDIRNLLGASQLTIDDGMISLFDSYITLKNDTRLGTKVLDDELLAGGYRARTANNLIKYHAACETISKLELTQVKTHTEDNISVTHFEADLGRLKFKFKARFEEALGILNPEALSDINASGEGFFSAVTPTDPVTGV